MKKIDWKVAIVTGAGRGAGRAAAVALAGAGWTLVINDTGDPALPEKTLAMVTKAGGSGRIVQADISSSIGSEQLVHETLDIYGRLDLLVNNPVPTSGLPGDPLKIGEEELAEALATSLAGPFLLTRLAALAMADLVNKMVVRNPRIINIGCPNLPGESALLDELLAKTGAAINTQVFAGRLAQAGVSIYEIRAGSMMGLSADHRPVQQESLVGNGFSPLQSWGKAEDAAQAVLAIAEGKITLTNGQVIDLDNVPHT